MSAFESASSIAKKFGGDLTLLHQAFVSVYLPISNDEYFARIENSLKGLAESAEEFEGLNAKHELIRSDEIRPLNSILENYDLVVSATHGRSGFKNLFLGSYAEKLLRTSPCDVFITRNHEKTFSLNKILVAHDVKNIDSHTIKTATEWAKAFGAEITLLHVVDMWNGLYPPEFTGDDSLSMFIEKAKENAQSTLDEITSHSSFENLNYKSEVVEGNPSDVLIDRSSDFDLVIIGKHDQSNFEHFLLGSVAEKVVRSAKCSALVVNHKQS